ncbi:unnamed protein product, partial [Tilletia laevis]
LHPGSELLRFFERHPSIQGIHAPFEIQWADDDDDPEDPTHIYDNVRTLRVDDLQRYKEIVNGGGRPSQVILIRDDWRGPGMTDFVASKWWLDREDVAHALTCLEFSCSNHTMRDLIMDLDFTFNRKALPNLAELAVHRLEPLDEKDLGSLFVVLSLARALRVLRVSEWSAPVKENVLWQSKSFIHSSTVELLVNCRFPAAFEYFQWTGVHRGDPTYFRFLPTHDATSSMPAPTSSEEGAALIKRGRLQRIPSMFRAKISPVGVWDAPFDPMRASAILDHTGVVPSLAL